MSTYEVSRAHVHYLIDLGGAINVRSLHSYNRQQPLDLASAEDRRTIATALIAAAHSIAATEAEPDDTQSTPTRRATPPLRTAAQVAQALQWVRNYEYQVCGRPGWRESLAKLYTERLRDELEVRLVGFFATTWTFPESA